VTVAERKRQDGHAAARDANAASDVLVVVVVVVVVVVFVVVFVFVFVEVDGVGNVDLNGSL
jgi:hypothetical protein